MPDTDLRREDEIDQRANDMFSQHPDLLEREQNAGKSSVGDEAEEYLRNNTSGSKNPWTGKETNNSTNNIDAIKDKESSSGWQQNYTGKGANKSTGFTIKNFAKKKGPTGVIIALMLGGGVIGTSLLSPALLLVNMKNVFMNDLSDATPAQTIRSDYMIRNKIKGLQATVGVCTNAVSIRCKFSTMSKRQVNKFKKAGFTFDEEDKSRIPGRTTFKSMTFDPGDGREPIKISTPQELKDFARTPEGRAALFKAFNPKTDYFLNGDFSKMLGMKLGISKESKVKAGDEKEVKESFDKSTGASDAPPAEEGGRLKSSVDDSKSLNSEVSGKANLGFAAVSSVCEAYKTSSHITYAVKMAKIAATAAFVMTFMTETDKLIAGGSNPADSPDPSVISQLGNQATSVDNRKQIQNDNGQMVSNPDYGKSPTNSQGYQLAANNTAAPEKSAEKFSLGSTGLLASLAAFTTLPSKLGPIGKPAFRTLCKFAGNIIVGAGLMAFACGLGGIATAGAAFVACMAGQAAISVAIGVALGIGLGELSSWIIKTYGKDLLLGAATYGPDVGNAWFLGMSSILGGVAAFGGMMPANKSDIKSYFADTDSIRKETTAANVYLAKATPFDIYNQYSFLGSIAQPINATILSKNTIASKVAELFNLVPSSFASLGTAGAAYNEAAQPYSDQRFNQCDDQQLKDIGVSGDEFCNVRYTMSSTELNMDPDSNVQYMVDNGVVDENTGAPRTDIQTGQDYQKFLDNCVNRKDPLGSSDKGYDEDDWDTGKNCGPESSVDPTELSNFRVFTMDMQTEDAMDQDPSAGGGGASSTSGDTSTGELTGEPANAEPAGQGWELKDNTDYSSIPCAAGTTEDGTNTNQGNGTTVRVCLLKGQKISSVISDEVVKMFAAAQQDGVNITISSGLRTYAEQIAKRHENCPGGSLTVPAEQCHPQTAIPGQSNHEKGTAMDLNANGSNSVSQWLKQNAATYGFYNLPSESWHWSTSGR